MSTTKDHGNIVFECDECGETHSIEDPDFTLSWNAAKRDGWIARKVGNEWRHTCDCCQDED